MKRWRGWYVFTLNISFTHEAYEECLFLSSLCVCMCMCKSVGPESARIFLSERCTRLTSVRVCVRSVVSDMSPEYTVDRKVRNSVEAGHRHFALVTVSEFPLLLLCRVNGTVCARARARATITVSELGVERFDT